MQRLSDYTKRLLREHELEMALETAERHCLKTHAQPSRMISGIAITSRKRVDARGLQFTLPVPLLADHDCTKPLGRVTGIKIRGDELYFTAELMNSGTFAAAEAAWEYLLIGQPPAVSIALTDACEDSKGVAIAARLEELSLCPEGKDRDARLCRAWQRQNVVKLDEPTDVVIFDETRRPYG